MPANYANQAPEQRQWLLRLVLPLTMALCLAADQPSTQPSVNYDAIQNRTTVFIELPSLVIGYTFDGKEQRRYQDDLFVGIVQVNPVKNQSLFFVLDGDRRQRVIMSVDGHGQVTTDWLETLTKAKSIEAIVGSGDHGTMLSEAQRQSIQNLLTQSGYYSAARAATKFVCCGIKEDGKRIVFVCAASGGMMAQFDNVRVEIRKAIEALTLHQEFCVLFFQEDGLKPADAKLLPATSANKQRAYDLMDSITLRGPSQPNPAIKLAFTLHPDMVFFFASSNFLYNPDVNVQLFATLNTDHKCRVHTIDCGEGDDKDRKEGEKALRQIATDSGGTYAHLLEGEPSSATAPAEK